MVDTMSDPHRRPAQPPLGFSTGARGRSGDAGRDTVDDMPARPLLDEPPPPVTPTPVERPKMLTVAIVAWIASFVVGLGAITLSLLHGHKVRGQLVQKVHSLRPKLDLDDQKHVADSLLGASAIAGAVLVVLQLWFVHWLWARHRHARVALSVLGVLNIALLLLFEDALSGAVSLRDSSERLNALAHAAMIVIAIVAMFWASITHWLRRTYVHHAHEE